MLNNKPGLACESKKVITLQVEVGSASESIGNKRKCSYPENRGGSRAPHV